MTNSERLDAQIEEALQDFRRDRGSRKDDYYGLVFLTHVLHMKPTEAVDQISWGNHDLGIDGFYFDKEQESFRIFQFKNSRTANLFLESMQALRERGLPAIFGDHVAVPQHQPIVDEVRRALAAGKGEIGEVRVDFVFRGNPEEAEQKRAIIDLKERLEELGWLLERYFGDRVGDRVPLRVHFLQFDGLSLPARTDSFRLRLEHKASLAGPGDLLLYTGFAPIMDLYAMKAALGRKFLERNVRFALPAESHVNRSLASTFAAILLKKTEDARLFTFRHNGVTLAAGEMEEREDHYIARAPRLLNGAQTISTFADFWERYSSALSHSDELVRQILVPCRIVVTHQTDVITDITISANRQNPIQAWQLHANDQIQFQLEDWFRERGIPYQRQDRAFAKVPAEDWQEMEFRETRAVELVRLARTYLAVEGELGKLSRIGNVFENARDYADVFGPHRLRSDSRHVIVCYKSHSHLGRIVDEIKSKAAKYEFAHRTRDIVWALVCQAVLNEENDAFFEEYGKDLRRPHLFLERLRELGTTRARFLLDDLINDRDFEARVADGNFSFMRTSQAFKKAMQHASKRYGWTYRKLR